MTQRQVAEAVGIDQAHYSRIEGGKARPGRKTLKALMDTLQMDMASLNGNGLEPSDPVSALTDIQRAHRALRRNREPKSFSDSELDSMTIMTGLWRGIREAELEGDWTEMKVLCMRALAELGQEDDATNRRWDLVTTLAYSYTHLGQWSVAVESYYEAAGIATRVGELPDLARAYHNLGFVHAQLGSFLKSAVYYEVAMAIKKQIGWPWANTLAGSAEVHALVGEIDTAKKETEEAINLLEEQGESYRVGPFFARGLVAKLSGRLEDALRDFELAWVESLNRRIYNLSDSGTIDLIWLWTDTLLELGRTDEARDCVTRLDQAPVTALSEFLLPILRVAVQSQRSISGSEKTMRSSIAGLEEQALPYYAARARLFGVKHNLFPSDDRQAQARIASRELLRLTAVPDGTEASRFAVDLASTISTT